MSRPDVEDTGHSRGVVMDPSFTPGSACWIDVSSTDPAGSREFYAGLFGWTYQINPGHRRNTTALCAGRPVAGLAGVAAQAGQPPTWTLYLTSANIDHTFKVFTQWGGRVLYGPVEVPRQGKVLIGADPTGAVIGFWQPATPWTFHTTDPGALIWAELDTWQGALADKVFANLFGYHQQQIGDGRYVDYTTWSRGGRTMLGRLQMNDDWAAPGTAAHWMLHFAVNPRTGIDAAADRVLDLGGWVDTEPYDSELGRIARVADPSGASFALIDPTTRIPPAELAAGSARVDDPYDD
jgi:predicted enzyme related to lactoylglutathione lyase